MHDRKGTGRRGEKNSQNKTTHNQRKKKRKRCHQHLNYLQCRYAVRWNCPKLTLLRGLWSAPQDDKNLFANPKLKIDAVSSLLTSIFSLLSSCQPSLTSHKLLQKHRKGTLASSLCRFQHIVQLDLYVRPPICIHDFVSKPKVISICLPEFPNWAEMSFC